MNFQVWAIALCAAVAAEDSSQGGGAVLEVAGVIGDFDVPALATQGKIGRTLFVRLFGSNDESLSFTVVISVDYTGQRTGDLPPDDAAAGDNTDDTPSGRNPGVKR